MRIVSTKPPEQQVSASSTTDTAVVALLGELPGQNAADDQQYGMPLRSSENCSESTLSWDICWDETSKLGIAYDVGSLLLPPFSDVPWNLIIPSLKLREPNALLVNNSRELFEDVILPFRESVKKHHFQIDDIEDWEDSLIR
jgi:hypothetical protein